MILAIDPGPVESAWVEFDDGRPTAFAKEPNESVLLRIQCTIADEFAIEMIASYGMPVGASTFETCVWIGRFAQRWEDRRDFKGTYHPQPRLREELRFITRIQVKSHICHSGKASDANVRQALIDRYGGVEGKSKAIGKKANPGPLYGVSGDVWQALAVAIMAEETM